MHFTCASHSLQHGSLVTAPGWIVEEENVGTGSQLLACTGV